MSSRRKDERGLWGRELARVVAEVRSWPLHLRRSAEIRGIPPARHSVEKVIYPNGSQTIRVLDGDPDEFCDHAGHQWVPAGGGMLICAVCEETQWEES